MDYEKQIEAIKAVEKEKMVEKEPAPRWLKQFAGLLVLVVLFIACRSINWAPVATPYPTPRPSLIGDLPAATQTAIPTLPSTTTPWPTLTPIPNIPPPPADTPAPLPSQTPLPTHTAAPTYTPLPTHTPAPTWTPAATWTAVPTPIPLIVTIPGPATIVPTSPSVTDLLILFAAGVFFWLGIGGIGFSVRALWRQHRPRPLVVEVPPEPAALPSPTLIPVVLRRHEPVSPPLAPVTPVQSTPEVAPVTPLVSPPPSPPQNGSGAGPARITVTVEPDESTEVDEAVMLEFCAIWNGLKRPSYNKVIEAKWGSKDDKNQIRLALVKRAIEWGRGQGIVQPRRVVA
jgi:hypothetical protein